MTAWRSSTDHTRRSRTMRVGSCTPITVESRSRRPNSSRWPTIIQRWRAALGEAAEVPENRGGDETRGLPAKGGAHLDARPRIEHRVERVTPEDRQRLR